MSGPLLLLLGPLADPALVAALGLHPLAAEAPVLRGRLAGGQRAGIEAGDWPALLPGDAALPALPVAPSPALWRYAAVMGLAPVDHPQGRLMGIAAPPDGAGGAAPDWTHGDWPADLAAAVARELLAAPDRLAPDALARRLPMIGVWAASRLRAAAGPVSGGDLVAPHPAGDLRCHHRLEPHSGYFAVETWDLSHRTHAGGFTPEVRREAFVMGDAVVVLPWDPQRDRVLLIEQFRFGPALRHDPQPWLLETVAGRVDAGETVEEAARREALEEADLHVGRLFPAVHHYPSPGAVTEFLYLYVAIADLHDGAAGVHGLDSEAEDIRGLLLDRAELTRRVLAGEVVNGPLATLALWLEASHQRLRGELAAS